MRPLPPELLTGPFTREQATAHGVTSRMLEGCRFVRLFPRVWRHRDHEMTEDDWRSAAALALPPDAHLTGITRIQALGLHFGPRRPLRFVVERDLHVDLEDVFVHRTRKLAPVGPEGVSPAAAYLSYAAGARVIDAIKVGDWLLQHGHTTKEELRALALSALWRDGAHEVLWLLDHLREDSRSLMESETRAVLDFSGLPEAEINVPLDVGPDAVLIGDLVYRRWRVAVEYEGTHHQLDRDQYVADLGRLALMRAADVAYVQVTHEKLQHARTLVGEVHRLLVARGYDGPPPVLGERWRLLFSRVSVAVGPRRDRARGAVS